MLLLVILIALMKRLGAAAGLVTLATRVDRFDAADDDAAAPPSSFMTRIAAFPMTAGCLVGVADGGGEGEGEADDDEVAAGGAAAAAAGDLTTRREDLAGGGSLFTVDRADEVELVGLDEDERAIGVDEDDDDDVAVA